MIWLLFALIQIINIPLMILGWVICLYPRLAYELWLWWNDDDPPQPDWSLWRAYVWLALRNPVANLRHVPGVSGKDRPLCYRFFTIAGRPFYFKAGWMSDGYPAFSAGSGKGY